MGKQIWVNSQPFFLTLIYTACPFPLPTGKWKEAVEKETWASKWENPIWRKIFAQTKSKSLYFSALLYTCHWVPLWCTILKLCDLLLSHQSRSVVELWGRASLSWAMHSLACCTPRFWGTYSQACCSIMTALSFRVRSCCSKFRGHSWGSSTRSLWCWLCGCDPHGYNTPDPFLGWAPWCSSCKNV